MAMTAEMRRQAGPATADVAMNSWENYLHNKFDFYVRQRSHRRRYLEPLWREQKPISLRGYLARVPFLSDPYKRLMRERAWQRLASHLPQLYEVRALLGDDLSRLHFDDAIILRAVSERRYFLPQLHFEPFATVASREAFADPGYPHTYVGLPLERYALVLRPNGARVNVVSMTGFDAILNNWRQYLITRGSVEFGPQPGEVVFDCGACIGDNCTVFAGLVGPEGRVHGFDPVPLHNRFCALQAQGNPGFAHMMTFNQVAVGRDVRKASDGARADCGNISPGGLHIDIFDTISIDAYVDEHKLDRLDFIKMDIEGAEEDALKGAETAIRRFKPRLAISTYHRVDDFWSLPLQIKKINPGYRFAFEHHAPLDWESVIYTYQP